MNNPSLVKTPKEVLKSIFGYDAFRDQQEEIIEKSIEGEDVLVIMPTGGGKSLCYQVPAICMEGVTIVVSPLIALMQDQVVALRSYGVNAQALNSQLSSEAKNLLIQELKADEVKLLYISPEQAVLPSFIDFLKTLKVNLIAIDEAHCVSVWGNDFRPEYAQLDVLIKAFPNSAHMALTATADKATQKDIIEQLGLTNPKQFLSSFERTNLSSSVLPGQNRLKVIKDFLKHRKGEAGIVYCLSRKGAEDMASKLKADGYKAAHYHGRMDAAKRNKVQDDFKKDDIDIVCATIAFGMGIDKSNIRWVIHYNLPKNLESYYQEIGRAGRDGVDAETLLFFSYGDVQTLRGFIDKSEAETVFKEVQLAKLDRMLEYCQATNCRTNVVLSYFGEHKTTPCGRCDNCLNPPEHIDGTILSQKILSAAYRLKEQVSLLLLVDVLRGARKQEVFQHGYDRIKTYGALREEAYFDMIQYVNQLINQGMLEIDYTEASRLKITKLGHQVLFDGKEVSLTLPVDRSVKKSEKEVKKNKKFEFEQSLFNKLKALRKQIADSQGVPAFVVFSDKTLQEIASEKPLTMANFNKVSGVGDQKLKQYGKTFIELLQAEASENNQEVRLKGATFIETLQLYKKGLTPEEISKKRNLNEGTIFSHLVKLYEEGEEIDLNQFISEEEKEAVVAIWNQLGQPESIKEVFEALGGEVSYGAIRIAIALRTH